ncbi:MAG: peptidase [Rickettsiaceae bacterium]|nr:peptidase [Rickettsiaceae bacterium]
MHPIIRRYYLITLKALGIILKLAAVDQLSKWWFIGYLKSIPLRTVEVTSFFNLVYVWNYGISFGMFSNYYQYANKFFIFFNILVIIYLFYLLLNCTTVKSFIGYCLIVGGAVGNLYDRIMRGAVFDFINLHYEDYHFAVFNIADSYITIGALLLIYDYYKAGNVVEEIDPIAIEAEKIRQLHAQERKNKAKNL